MSVPTSIQSPASAPADAPATQREPRPRVVAAVATFDEAHFIPRWLKGIERVADAVVAIDDGSTDGSPELLRAHPLVADLHVKRRGKREEVKDRRRLTRMALEQGADWILFLDADEAFDGRIVDVMPDLLAADDVGEWRFRKYTLWRHEGQIRLDRPEKFSAWSPCRMLRAAPNLRWRYPQGADLHHYAAVLARRARHRPQFGHDEVSGRPGPIRHVEADQAVIVHYASVDYDRMIRKQLRYAAGEAREHPRRPLDDIAAWAYKMLDESDIEVGPLPADWGDLP